METQEMCDQQLSRPRIVSWVLGARGDLCSFSLSKTRTKSDLQGDQHCGICVWSGKNRKMMNFNFDFILHSTPRHDEWDHRGPEFNSFSRVFSWPHELAPNTAPLNNPTSIWCVLVEKKLFFSPFRPEPVDPCFSMAVVRGKCEKDVGNWKKNSENHQPSALA